MMVIGATLLLVPIVASALIDVRRLIIPNELNLFILVSGIAFYIATDASFLRSSIIGVLLGGFIPYMISRIFTRVRGYPGLGMGDVKFIAAAGAWIGWMGLPPMLLLAATAALISVGIKYFLSDDFSLQTRIPFAPFLGGATFSIWILQTMNISPWIAP